MELEAIRKMVQEHPEGVIIRLVNGTEFKIPHRDYLSFGAPREMLNGKKATTGSSFIVFEHGDVASMRLVNALLVSEVLPWHKNGNGHPPKTRKKR
jgi:hypothetical protein